ncbi:hypothetical protein V5N11_005599 [Cardamine amara subsp. amara]|uniref:Uncharacterized protein n=1 Tax=Cardamine amara subsp. amara TaxID=228776 RepID=A0ABD1B9J3_CARAN
MLPLSDGSNNFFLPRATIIKHTPCCIHLDCHIPQARTKPFKFYNYLTFHPDFLAVVANAWIDTEKEERSLHNLNVKQKMIKRELRALNKNNFLDIQKRVYEANNLFSNAHVQSLNHPTETNYQVERLCLIKLTMLKGIEKEYFKQRSTINWLLVGDLNTSYFHKVTKARNAFNTIHTLIGLDGMEATSPEHLGLLAANHFRAILGPEVLPALEDSLSQIRSSTRYFCTSQAAVVLSKVPPAEDIQKAIFRLNQNKSPGPDGLTS